MVAAKADGLKAEEQYTHDRYPLLNVQDGIGIFPNHYTRLVRLGGVDSSLRVAGERFSLMQLIGGLHDYFHQKGVRIMYLYEGRKSPPDEIVSRYHAASARETNPDIQRLAFEDATFLRELGETAPPFKRRYTLGIGQPKTVRRAEGTFDLDLIRKGTWLVALREGFKELYYAGRKVFTGQESPEQLVEMLKDKRDRPVPKEVRVALDQMVRQAIRVWHKAGTSAAALSQLEHVQLVADLCAGTLDPEQPVISQLYGQLDEEPWEYLRLRQRLLGADGTLTHRDQYLAVLAARKLPPYITFDYLSSLVALTDVEQIEVALHLNPLPDRKVLRKIEDETRRIKSEKNLGNEALYWQQSLNTIEQEIRGRTGHCYAASVVVSVRENSPEKLKTSLDLVYGEMDALGLGPCVQTLDFFRGHVSSLPFCENALLEDQRVTGSFEQNVLSDSSACLVPTSVVEFYHPGPHAVFYGLTEPHRSVVYVDPSAISEVRHKGRWGMTGSGKSQSEIGLCFRMLTTDNEIECIVVDPKGGWENLCAEVGGVQVDYTYTRINLLDRWAGGNLMPLTDKVTYLSGAFGLLTGQRSLTQEEGTANAEALRELYQHFERGADASPVIRNALQSQRRYYQRSGLTHYLVAQKGQAAKVEIEQVLARAASLRTQLWQQLGIQQQLEHAVSMPTPPPPDRLLRYSERGELIEEYISQPHPLAEATYAACWEAYYNDSELNALTSGCTAWEREQLLRTLLLEYRFGTPTLFDQLIYLYAHGGDGSHLAYLLRRYVDPELNGPTFDGLTNLPIEGNRFILFSLIDVPKEQMPFAIYNVLGFVWNRMVDTIKTRHLWIDEFTFLLDQGVKEIADFAELIAIGGRAFGMGGTFMSQTPLAFERTPQGQEIMANLAVREVGYIPDEETRRKIGKMFGWTQGETDAVGQLDRGESLYEAGRNRTIIRYEFSPRELKLLKTSVMGKKDRQAQAKRKRQAISEQRLASSLPVADAGVQ